jgi:dTDP-4-dehydrorhamnose 3,5-epimerase
MKFIQTKLPDVLLIEPHIHSDKRGFFIETYQRQRFSDAGIPMQFVQNNHAGSNQGVLRGLHYQIKQSQGKLVYVISGEVFDVVVDLRHNSKTFGSWIGTFLTAENRLQKWVPPGFAHGYYVLSKWAEIIYCTTQLYTPEWERVLIWNDPDLNINWPLINNEPPILSPKDLNGLSIKQAELPSYE